MIKLIFSGILIFGLSAPVYTQDLELPALEGFRKISNYPVYTPDNLWDFIDGAADSYLALGFADLHVAEYKKGRDIIKLEIYRHNDHTQAFGIYSSERSPSYNFNDIGSQGYSVDGVLNFFKGNYYVKIRAYPVKPKLLQFEESLARRVASMLPGETGMPSVLAKFPAEGKKPNEETFIGKSVLGHEFLNRAFRASYQSANDIFSIYIFKSESQDETLKAARDYLAIGGIEPDQSESKYVFSDGYNGTIFLSWKDDIMVVISGLARDQADIAEKYTSEILK